MNLKTTDTPPKPLPRYDYVAIAQRALSLRSGQGMEVTPCPSNITLFKRNLSFCLEAKDGLFDVFTRDGTCWIVRNSSI